MVSTDSCLAESMKLQVLTTRISASSARAVSSAPARSSRPIITSESTRFLGQPSETNPIFGRCEIFAAAGNTVESVLITGWIWRGSRTEDGTPYFTSGIAPVADARSANRAGRRGRRGRRAGDAARTLDRSLVAAGPGRDLIRRPLLHKRQVRSHSLQLVEDAFHHNRASVAARAIFWAGTLIPCSIACTTSFVVFSAAVTMPSTRAT